MISGDPAKYPLDFQERLLELMGVVSVSPVRRPLYFRPVAIFQQLVHLYGLMVTSLYILGDHPFFDKMESSQYLLALIHMCTKYINLHYNTGPYRKLVLSSKQLWEEAKRLPDMQDLLVDISLKTEKELKFFLVLFWGGFPISCLVTFLTNMHMEPEERGTLYQVWSPVPDDSWYWTKVASEGSSMCFCLLMLGTDVVACYGHCLQAASQLKILQAMLEKKQFNLRPCAQLHNKVLRYIDDINKYFSGQMFLVIVLASLLCATRGYITIRLVNSSNPKAVSSLFFLLLCLVEPLIICLSGHVITENSERLFKSAYQNAWYNTSQREKSSLKILMCQASRTKRLNYRNILDFNMERYFMVIQSVYSYITLLQRVDV